MSPTVLNKGPYRFYFFSHDGNEPPHIHVDRDDSTIKFWLSPIALAYSIGFSAKELRKIQKMVESDQKKFLEAWNGYFGIKS